MERDKEDLTREKLELAISCSEKELVRAVAKKMYKQKYGQPQENSMGDYLASDSL